MHYNWRKPGTTHHLGSITTGMIFISRNWQACQNWGGNNLRKTCSSGPQTDSNRKMSQNTQPRWLQDKSENVYEWISHSTWLDLIELIGLEPDWTERPECMYCGCLAMLTEFERLQEPNQIQVWKACNIIAKKTAIPTICHI